MQGTESASEASEDEDEEPKEEDGNGEGCEEPPQLLSKAWQKVQLCGILMHLLPQE